MINIMNKQDVKLIFNWAKEYGDANIFARILVQVMPELLKEQQTLTSEDIESSDKIEVSEKLYQVILDKAEALVGMKYV